MSAPYGHKFIRIIVLYFIPLLIILSLAQFILLEPHESKFIDFKAFYTGATIVKQGGANELYNLTYQKTWQKRIVKEEKNLNQKFIPFYNFPFTIFPLLPLASLSLTQAYSIWLIINILILAALVLLMYKIFKKESLFIKLLGIFFILLFTPTIVSLLLGQWGILLCLIFLSMWYFAKQDRYFEVGVVSSLLLIKPQFILLPILFFIFQKQWSSLKGLFVGSLFLIGASILLVGWSEMISYFNLLAVVALSSNNNYGMDVYAQHNIQTLLLVATGARDITQIRAAWITSLVVLLGAFFLISRIKHKTNSLKFNLQWACLILATLLVSPHTHFHDLSILTTVNIILLYCWSSLNTKPNLLLVLAITNVVWLWIISTLTATGVFPGEISVFLNVSYLILEFAVLARMLIKKRAGKKV